MIENIAALTGPVETNTTTEKNADAIGKDSFLTLLLAQLRHQDPLNPMASQEFSAQLAQFTSVEQLFNINDHLEELKVLQDQNAGYQALEFIGKEIEAEGNALVLEDGKTAKGAFVLDSNAYCTVTIYNELGMPVKTINIGFLEYGRHEFSWDGQDESGELVEPGNYVIEVAALTDQTENGQLVPVTTRVTGEVTRVNLEGDMPLLYMGDLVVSLSQVLDIKVPTASVSP